MYDGSIEHGKIIEAFKKCVPDTYVRDYRDNRGFITVCRGYKDIPWNDQLSTRKVYKTIPDRTLLSLPRGNVTSPTIYRGLVLERPGWRHEFRKAMDHISRDQMKAITKFLGCGEVFPGVH